jgi:hypothetical protein
MVKRRRVDGQKTEDRKRRGGEEQERRKEHRHTENAL